MAALVDYSQVCLSVVFGQIDSRGNLRNQDTSYLFDESEDLSLSEDLIRHLLLNSILFLKRKFAGEWGEFIYCVDDKDPWRTRVFPHYKLKRKRNRENSELDWELIYGFVDKFHKELKEELGYKVLKVHKAEADDIIATLTKNLTKAGEKILILSSDKDFAQLQRYPGVVQYSLARRDYIEVDDPEIFLKDHIIRGDDNDSIPNIFSSINSFHSKTKQKPCFTKKIEKWLLQDIGDIPEWDDQIHKRFKQNKILIDFEHIPSKIQDRIMGSYEDAISASMGNGKVGLKALKQNSRFTDYFVKNGLVRLFEHIGEF